MAATAYVFAAGLQLKNFPLPVGSTTKTSFLAQKLLITNSWFGLSSLNSHKDNYNVSRIADSICVSIPAGLQLQNDNAHHSNHVVRSRLSSVNLYSYVERYIACTYVAIRARHITQINM